MKIRNLGYVMAAVGFFAVSISALHADVKTLRKQMEKEYRQEERFFAAKDADALNARIAPEFSSVWQGGQKITRDQMAAETTTWFKSLKSISAKYKIQSVKQVGDSVIVDAKYTFKTISTPDAKGKTHKMTMIGTNTKTWVKTGDKWLMTSYQEGPNGKVLMDGRPMSMGETTPEKKD